MNTDNKRTEYISIRVTKEEKERLQKIEKYDQQEAAFEEIIKTISEQSKAEYKTNFESLEEDLIMYQGLMLKTKKMFEAAKNEQLSASYELWEKFDAELGVVKKKINTMQNVLSPVAEQIKNLNDMLAKINTYNIEKVVDVISRLSALCDKDKQMISFLISNFKIE